MPATLRNRLVAAVAVTVLAPAAAQALSSRPLPVDPVARAAPAAARPAAGAGGSAATAENEPGRAAQSAAVRYWTPARMAAVAAAGQRLPAAPAQPDEAQPDEAQPVPAQSVPARPVAARAQAAGQPGGPGRPAQTRELVWQAPAAAWLSGNSGGSGLRWTRGGTVAAAVGKVFFTLGGADYVCSGTLVGPGRTAIVLTAAHCVSGGASHPGTGHTGTGHTGTAQWATNWVFVPGYRNGGMPAGEYTARRFYVPAQWAGPQGGTEQYDVAFVQLTAATLNAGDRAAVAPRGLPLRFASSQDAGVQGGGVPARAYVFGYPAEPPYSGLFPNFCAGPDAAAGGSARTACTMTAGDSGGPWLAGFSPRGTGAVFAVTTYKLSTSQRQLYGAVLGPRARALYARALSTAG